MAKLIREDGRCEVVKPARGKFTLEEVQTLVGGYVQACVTVNNQVMLVDEDAKMKRKRLNRVATDLYQFGKYDAICGDVLIVAQREWK